MSKASQYDLTHLLGKSIDPHLLLKVLLYLGEKKVYPTEDIINAQIKVLSSTNIVGFEIEKYNLIQKTVPTEVEQKKEFIESEKNRLASENSKIIKFIESGNYNEIKEENSEEVLTKFEISEEEVENFYKYAKFIYECGKYSDAALYLRVYRLISKNPSNSISSLWGKFAADILVEQWDEALDDVNKIREFIDNPFGVLNHRQQLHHRTWLLTWSLFVFFNHPSGLKQFLQYLLENRYRQVLQNGCPWLLRYMVAAIILSKPSDEQKRVDDIIRENLKLITQEEYQYSDALTRLAQNVYIDYNFDEADELLHQVEELLENDYFLQPLKNSILTNIKTLIFETYCSVHCRIDLEFVSKKLGKTEQETEDFMRNVIDKSYLKSTIDKENKIIQIHKKVPSQYQQLLDKTKTIENKLKSVSQNLEK